MATTTKAGDVVIIAKGRIKLSRPVYQLNGIWFAPGHRWIESRQKFSSNALIYMSREEPRLVEG